MATINTVAARERLKPQNEPHWHRLSSGCTLGFRKLTPASVGTWVVRVRDAATGARAKHSLGEFSELPAARRYDAAKEAAEAFARELRPGVSLRPQTVAQAGAAYVEHVRAQKGPDAADDLEARLCRTVIGSPISEVELQRLTRQHIERWRKALAARPALVSRDSRPVPETRPRSAATVNREASALRAVLNHAHDQGLVSTDVAWRAALRATPNAGGRRDVYLDRDQRRALIGCAAPDLADFLRGLSLLPLRPGALASLAVASLDRRLGALTVGKDKAGADRKLKLPAGTAEFLLEKAKDKLPGAPLLARGDGQAWTKDAWKGPIKDAARAAGLPEATTAYALRHSVITDLVAGGLDLLTVAQLSGTGVVMIERHYGHLQNERAAAALAKLAL